jgi:hypothetical protein
VRLHGIPKTIVSDRGTQFVACFFGTIAWIFGNQIDS